MVFFFFVFFSRGGSRWSDVSKRKKKKKTHFLPLKNKNNIKAGALSTVDRDYGRFLNAAHHHIADTHVLHHLFSQIPHYHAEEATAAIRPVLGEYYARDGGRGILRSIWEDFRECAVVSADAREEAKEGKRAPLWFRRLVE